MKRAWNDAGKMKPSKIFVTLDHNEAMRPRAEKVERAVLEDDRFEMRDPDSLPFDLNFSLSDKVFHIEIKDFSEDGNSDYLSSVLSGHLYEQVLAARELQEPLAVVVLGDDNDVGAAIRKAASRGQGGRRVDPEKLLEYFRMVEGFEANCIALGVPVWRLKTDPWKRMLLRVRKILEGGDLTTFCPSPAKNERVVVGFSIICGKGIGTKKAESVLSHYTLGLIPNVDGFDLSECVGIGDKLCKQIQEKFMVFDSGKV